MTAPDNLNHEAWEDWCQHRKEIGKPIKPGTMTEKKNLKALAKLSHEDQEFVVDWCIEKNWQGIYTSSALKHKPSKDEQGLIERQSDRSWMPQVGTSPDNNVRQLKQQ